MMTEPCSSSSGATGSGGGSNNNGSWWKDYVTLSSWDTLSFTQIHDRLQTILDHIELYQVHEVVKESGGGGGVDGDGASDGDPLCEVLLHLWVKILAIPFYRSDSIDGDGLCNSKSCPPSFSSSSSSASLTWSAFSLLTSIFSMILTSHRNKKTMHSIVMYMVHHRQQSFLSILYYTLRAYMNSHWLVLPLSISDMNVLKRVLCIIGKTIALLRPASSFSSSSTSHDSNSSTIECILPFLPLVEKIAIIQCLTYLSQASTTTASIEKEKERMREQERKEQQILFLLESIVECQRDIIKTLTTQFSLHQTSQSVETTVTTTISNEYVIALVNALILPRYFSTHTTTSGTGSGTGSGSGSSRGNVSGRNVSGIISRQTKMTLLVNYLLEYWRYSLMSVSNRDCLLLSLTTGDICGDGSRSSSGIVKTFVEQLVYTATAIIQHTTATTQSSSAGNRKRTGRYTEVLGLTSSDRTMLTNLFYCISYLFTIPSSTSASTSLNESREADHLLVQHAHSHHQHQQEYDEIDLARYELTPYQTAIMTLLFQSQSSSSSMCCPCPISSITTTINSSSMSVTSPIRRKRPLLSFLRRSQHSNSQYSQFSTATTTETISDSHSSLPPPPLTAASSVYHSFELQSWLEDVMMLIEQQVLQPIATMERDRERDGEGESASLVNEEGIELITVALSIPRVLFTHLLSTSAIAFNYQQQQQQIQLQRQRESERSRASTGVTGGTGGGITGIEGCSRGMTGDITAVDLLLHPSILHQQQVSQHNECEAVIRLLSFSTIARIFQYSNSQCQCQVSRLQSECCRLLSLYFYAMEKKQEMNYSRCDHILQAMMKKSRRRRSKSMKEREKECEKEGIQREEEKEIQERSNRGDRCVYELVLQVIGNSVEARRWRYLEEACTVMIFFLRLSPMMIEIVMQRNADTIHDRDRDRDMDRDREKNRGTRESEIHAIQEEVEACDRLEQVKEETEEEDEADDDTTFKLSMIDLQAKVWCAYWQQMLLAYPYHHCRVKEEKEKKNEITSDYDRVLLQSIELSTIMLQCCSHIHNQQQSQEAMEIEIAGITVRRHPKHGNALHRMKLVFLSSDQHDEKKHSSLLYVLQQRCSISIDNTMHNVSLVLVKACIEFVGCLLSFSPHTDTMIQQEVDDECTGIVVRKLISYDWLSTLLSLMTRLHSISFAKNKETTAIEEDNDNVDVQEEVEISEEEITQTMTLLKDIEESLFYRMMRVSSLRTLLLSLNGKGETHCCDSNEKEYALVLFKMSQLVMMQHEEATKGCYLDAILKALCRWIQDPTCPLLPSSLLQVARTLLPWLKHEQSINTSIPVMEVIVAIGYAKDHAVRTLSNQLQGALQVSEVWIIKEHLAVNELDNLLHPLIQSSFDISFKDEIKIQQDTQYRIAKRQGLISDLILDPSREIVIRLKENFEKMNTDLFDRIFEAQEMVNECKNRK